MTSRFDQALVFAAQLHKDQRRKGSGVPYVSHLLAVAALGACPRINISVYM